MMLKHTLLLCFLLFGAVMSTDFEYKNNCGAAIDIWLTANGAASKNIGSVAPGKSISGPNLGSFNAKVGQNGKSLAEFTTNSNGIDYYDISFIVGFDYGIEVISSTGGTTLNCPKESCSQAYHNPGDKQTYTCKTGGQFTVVFCP